MPTEETFAYPFTTRKMLAFEHGMKLELDIDIFSPQGRPLKIIGFTKEGIFTFKITPASSVNVQNFLFRIPDIPIAITAIGTDVNSKVGDVTIYSYLSVNSTRIMGLVQGIISFNAALSWPTNFEQTPIQKIGKSTIVSAGVPAAGAEVNITLPDNDWIKLEAIKVLFVTAIAVANRRVSLLITLPSGIEYRISSPAILIASLTTKVFAAPGINNIYDSDNNIMDFALPNDLILEPGTNIKTITANIAAADQYGQMDIYGKHFYTLP